jgi:hypothetical protein
MVDVPKFIVHSLHNHGLLVRSQGTNHLGGWNLFRDNIGAQ